MDTSAPVPPLFIEPIRSCHAFGVLLYLVAALVVFFSPPELATFICLFGLCSINFPQNLQPCQNRAACRRYRQKCSQTLSYCFECLDLPARWWCAWCRNYGFFLAVVLAACWVVFVIYIRQNNDTKGQSIGPNRVLNSCPLFLVTVISFVFHSKNLYKQHNEATEGGNPVTDSDEEAANTFETAKVAPTGISVIRNPFEHGSSQIPEVDRAVQSPSPSNT